MSNIKYQYQVISILPESLSTALNDKGNKGWRLINIVHKETKITMHTTQYTYECIFEKIIY